MLFLLFACWEDPIPTIVDLPSAAISPPESALDKVKEAASIANAIEREPERADLILANNGTTREEYEALLYDIAINPSQAKTYARLRAPETK